MIDSKLVLQFAPILVAAGGNLLQGGDFSTDSVRAGASTAEVSGTDGFRVAPTATTAAVTTKLIARYCNGGVVPSVDLASVNCDADGLSTLTPSSSSSCARLVLKAEGEFSGTESGTRSSARSDTQERLEAISGLFKTLQGGCELKDQNEANLTSFHVRVGEFVESVNPLLSEGASSMVRDLMQHIKPPELKRPEGDVSEHPKGSKRPEKRDLTAGDIGQFWKDVLEIISNVKIDVKRVEARVESIEREIDLIKGKGEDAQIALKCAYRQFYDAMVDVAGVHSKINRFDASFTKITKELLGLMGPLVNISIQTSGLSDILRRFPNLTLRQASGWTDFRNLLKVGEHEKRSNKIREILPCIRFLRSLPREKCSYRIREWIPESTDESADPAQSSSGSTKTLADSSVSYIAQLRAKFCKPNSDKEEQSTPQTLPLETQQELENLRRTRKDYVETLRTRWNLTNTQDTPDGEGKPSQEELETLRRTRKDYVETVRRMWNPTNTQDTPDGEGKPTDSDGEGTLTDSDGNAGSSPSRFHTPKQPPLGHDFEATRRNWELRSSSFVPKTEKEQPLQRGSSGGQSLAKQQSVFDEPAAQQSFFVEPAPQQSFSKSAPQQSFFKPSVNVRDLANRINARNVEAKTTIHNGFETLRK